MALYLGEDKVKINLDGVAYCLNSYFMTTAINNALLLTSDNCILTDSSGAYLTTKEDE